MCTPDSSRLNHTAALINDKLDNNLTLEALSAMIIGILWWETLEKGRFHFRRQLLTHDHHFLSDAKQIFDTLCNFASLGIVFKIQDIAS
jgi:hypothetical protein